MGQGEPTTIVLKAVAQVDTEGECARERLISAAHTLGHCLDTKEFMVHWRVIPCTPSMAYKVPEAERTVGLHPFDLPIVGHCQTTVTFMWNPRPHPRHNVG